jgi:hypothetical protein
MPVLLIWTGICAIESLDRHIKKLESVDEAYSWLESAKSSLKTAKTARITEIKRQYDYDGSVEIGDNTVHSYEIPKGSSPDDIKQMMVFSAQAIVDAIQDRIDKLLYKEKDLFNEKYGNAKNSAVEFGGLINDVDNAKETLESSESEEKSKAFISKVNKKIFDKAYTLWQAGPKKAANGLYGISGDTEKYKAWGGKEWKSEDQHRIYFNGAKALKNLYGLRIVRTTQMLPGDIVSRKIKNNLGMNRLRVHDEERMRNKALVSFMSLVLISQIHKVISLKNLLSVFINFNL